MLRDWKHNYTQTYFAFSNVQLSGGALIFYQPAASGQRLPLSEMILEPDLHESIMKIKEVRPHCFEHNRNEAQQARICSYVDFDDCE